MLVPSFFVVDFNGHDDISDIQLPTNGFIAFKISSGSAEQLNRFYKKLFLTPKKYSFCFHIDFKNQSVESHAEFKKLIDYMVSCSFHSQYVKTSQDNPILLVEMEGKGTEHYVSSIRQSFICQGYNDINTISVSGDNMIVSEGESHPVCFNLKKDLDGFLTECIAAFKKLTSCNLCFFFFLSEPTQLKKVLLAIEETEITLRKDLPRLYHLLRENSSLAAKKEQLLFKIELLQQQLDSVGNYHLYYNAPDTRYRRQITELLRFYKSEYEILPMWYKRFGHIIKVLMGKRTFRSLFNDNVKKYKD